MGDPPGEVDRGALRLDFNRRLLLQFRDYLANVRKDADHPRHWNGVVDTSQEVVRQLV